MCGRRRVTFARYRMICLVLLILKKARQILIQSWNFTIKTTYKQTKNENLVVWNQYTLFDSSRFSHSDCGVSIWNDVCQQENIVGRKIVANIGLEPATSGLQSKRAPYVCWYVEWDLNFDNCTAI